MIVYDKLTKWLVSDDVGASSLAMAAILSGNESRSAFSDHPLDSWDFGRCVRLLDAVPELRERLSMMSSRSAWWAALIAHWDELEALYRAGSPEKPNEKLWDRIHEILDPVYRESMRLQRERWQREREAHRS